VVPAGLTINSASAGDGTCSTLGQNVTCTITGLAAGQSVPVNVVVTPSAPGSYTSHVSVAVPSTNPDPNSANNAASLTLAVEQVVPARCVVPKLKEVSAGLAKSVLKDLGCKVKLKHQRSGVHKGDVIGTSPGPGTHAYLAKVTVKVSSGKKH
jgi:beta-lactam-binding protein with PASTA domain